MFQCVPLRPGIYSEDVKVQQGDILRIAWPHDDETWPFHLFDEEWMTGLRSGMESLFTGGSNQEEEYDTDIDSGSESEFDATDAAWGNVLSFEERAKEVAQRWIEKNKFARFLKDLGPTKSKMIQHIRILWGAPEEIQTGELIEVGPYAIGIMSIVFGKYLPNLKEVALQLRHAPEGVNLASFSQYCWTCALELNDKQDFEDHAYEHTENEQSEVMGTRNLESAHEFQYVQALVLLMQNCSSLSMLRLENWHSQSSRLVWPEWWWDLVKRDGLAMTHQFPFPMPWIEEQVMKFPEY